MQQLQKHCNSKSIAYGFSLDPLFVLCFDSGDSMIILGSFTSPVACDTVAIVRRMARDSTGSCNEPLRLFGIQSIFHKMVDKGNIDCLPVTKSTRYCRCCIDLKLSVVTHLSSAALRCGLREDRIAGNTILRDSENMQCRL
jgi:hypothetical protein